jgi:hypothetical protein
MFSDAAGSCRLDLAFSNPRLLGDALRGGRLNGDVVSEREERKHPAEVQRLRL